MYVTHRLDAENVLWRTSYRLFDLSASHGGNRILTKRKQPVRPSLYLLNQTNNTIAVQFLEQFEKLWVANPFRSKWPTGPGCRITETDQPAPYGQRPVQCTARACCTVPMSIGSTLIKTRSELKQHSYLSYYDNYRTKFK